MQQLAAQGERPLRLHFERPHRLRDLLSGEEHAAARQHQLSLDVWRGLFLQVEAAE